MTHVVIGGGIVGASAAYHLARAGAETLLVDRDDPGRATDAGAGIVSPGTSSSAAGARFEFAVAAYRYYPDLVEAVESTTGESAGFDEPGTLVVAVDENEERDLLEAREHIADRRAETGFPPTGSIREVDPAEARDRFPPLADGVRRALYYEGGARVDGERMNRALLSAGEAEGLSTLVGDAERIVVEDGAVAGVEVDGERLDADGAVLAAGAWSGRFAPDLGIEVPVEPQRGQIAHLSLPDAAAAPGTDTGEWPITYGFREHYLVPWPGGRIAAGATRETGSGFAPYPTARGVEEVVGEALRVAPGLAGAEFVRIRAGLRPRSPDGDPLLGAVPGVEGAYLATGHGSTGLQLGPYSGKVVADAALGAERAPAAFDPARF